jgi:hypothetical protein
MALKGDRYEFFVDISNFGNSVMTRGGVASYAGLGSGGAMDQSQAFVAYAANSSGQYPAGLLLNDMVNIDLTRQHINWYQDQIIIGGKVTLGKKGYWVTNNLTQGPNPIAVGDLAVLTSSGNIMNIAGSNLAAGSWNKALNPYVGTFLSTADEDGYAKISIEIH